MICPICSRWCAKTEEQLANRLANMSSTPDAKPFECPQCGGGDWATSREMIKEAVPEEKPKWWRRWLPKEPPSWRALRAVNWVFAVFFFVVAACSTDKWLVLVDAWVAGFNLAAALHATQMVRLMEAFASMRAAFDAMVQINQDLLQARIESLQFGRDDDTPIAPKLH